jgi:magnesium chelatase subunit I
VEVTTPTEIRDRVEVVRRRDAFDRDPGAFMDTWAREDEKVRRRISRARKALPGVEMSDAALTRAAELCIALGTDGLRGELTLMRAARAFAALEGDETVDDSHLRAVAPSALRHRLRRNPLDDTGSTARVERAIAEVFGA